MTGYQQAVLMLLGVDTGGKCLVRCVDRWYVDAVAELFPTAPYLQRRADGKKDFWTVKSAKVHLLPSLADVTDWHGFCRGVVELQGNLRIARNKSKIRPGEYYYFPCLRIYGQPDLLFSVARHLPARPKKLQTVKTNTGATYCFIYQSRREVYDILDWLRGDPENSSLWSKWEEILKSERDKYAD